MSLKDDLLKRGYLPENLPPAFTSEHIADHLPNAPPRGYLMNHRKRLQAARYNASKRGLTRRVFSVVHPVTAHDMATFVDTNWQQLTSFFQRTNASFSVPIPDPESRRALIITPHFSLQEAQYARLSSYRFVAYMDIARFYHSIYTHSIPWAFHGKASAKTSRGRRASQLLFDQADSIIRNGQDGQSIGIPVGPDTSRVFAEVIGTAIDIEFENRREGVECTLLRHVDDVWIGANSHADAEMALTRYREAIREFELDINENKTEFFSEDFSFSDSWPAELSAKVEFAVHSDDARAKHHLRSALEHCFALAVQRKDDGILRYVLRYLDQNGLNDGHWDVIEPLLKRSSVHFGHTIDFVGRILLSDYVPSSSSELLRPV